MSPTMREPEILMRLHHHGDLMLLRANGSASSQVPKQAVAQAINEDIRRLDIIMSKTTMMKILQSLLDLKAGLQQLVPRSPSPRPLQQPSAYSIRSSLCCRVSGDNEVYCSTARMPCRQT